MAEDRSSYKIDIRTSSDTSGAKQTQEALAGVKTAAEGAGESLGGVTIETGKAGQSAEETSHKMTEGAEAMDIHARRGRELREILHLLGPEFEAVAESTHFLEGPLLLAIGLLAVGFSKLRESIAETDKEMDAMAQSAAKPIGNLLESQATAATEASDAYRRFAASLIAASANEGAMATAIQGRITLYNEELDQLKKLTAERERAALAQIQLDEALKRISPEQASALRANITGREQREETGFDRDRRVNEIAEYKRGLDQAVAEQAGAPASEKTLREQREEAARRFHTTESSKDALQEALTNRQKALDDASAEYDNQVNRSSVIRGDLAADPGNERLRSALELSLKAVEEARQKVAEETAARDTAVHAVKSNEEATKRLKSKLDDLTDQYDKLIQHNGELSAAIAEFKHKIEEATASLKITDRYSGPIQSAQDAATRAQAEAEAARAGQHAQRGGQPTAETESEQDGAGQSPLATESGPEAAIDASAAVVRAREIEAGMLGRKGSPDEMAELHEILNRILGLQENHARELNGQRGDLSEQRHRIEMLESHSSYSRYNSH